MKRVLIFVLFLSSFLNAQSIQFTASDNLMVDEIFNGNFATADSIVNNQLTQNPEGPKYYFLKSYVLFYGRYLAGSGMSRDSLINLTKHYTWKAIQEGEKVHDNFENKFFIGSAYGFLSRVNIMDGEYWEGYWNAVKCEDYMEELIDENPDFGDAYIPLSIFTYWPAVNLTGWQSFFAWFGGMSGDREEGLKYLQTAYNKSELFKNEASYLLALSQGAFFENNAIQSYKYWSDLNSQFPNNRMFATQKDRANLAYLIETKGTGFLDAELDQLAEKYNINNPFVLNLVGYGYINKEEYDKALKVFSTNIKLYPDVANCYDSYAECYYTMGDYDNSIKFYNIAYKKLDTDTTANDDFKNRLREGIRDKLDDMGGELSM